MEEKELKVEDIPWGYALCFNSECGDKDRCMHYQAWLLMPKDRYSGQAVFPTAWENGKCRCFREKKLVKKAWGFSKLYHNVPQRQRAEARECVHALFGSGNGPYYRAHHGENMLAPKAGRNFGGSRQVWQHRGYWVWSLRDRLGLRLIDTNSHLPLLKSEKLLSIRGLNKILHLFCFHKTSTYPLLTIYKTTWNQNSH